ncbi:MAG: FAD-binding protein [Williamsia sp.]|nr:FAD-binding protein [Williamsia sp.]
MNRSANQQPGYIKITPSTGDARFPSFLQGFNRRWAAENCQAIYLCHTPEGTAHALDDAFALYHHQIKIKSGGHCYENFVFNEDTRAIIDVTPMAAHNYDEKKGFYLESGGTNWTAFQGLFRDYGKVLPAGSCYSVGLGGHICGGGYGLLSRLNGLTVDWLTGVEVVVKDEAKGNAYPIYVSSDSTNSEELDLYWAHRGGGGGNFGVITKYYFRDLPTAPKAAFITGIAYSWDELTPSLLQKLLDFFADFSRRTDNWRQFGIFALNHKAAGEMHLTFQTVVLPDEDAETINKQYVNPLLTALRAIHPYQLITKPGIAQHSYLLRNSADTVLYTFYEAVQLLNGSGTNQRGKYKSAYMRKPFPEDQVAAIYKWLTMVPEGLPSDGMQQSLLQVDSYGGRINLMNAGDTAIPQRSSILKLQYQTYWSQERYDQYHLDWIRGFYTDVYKHTGGVPDPNNDSTKNVDGCYYNYPDIDLNGRDNDKGKALGLYFGINLDRLKKTKRRWDKNNYFVSSQSL